METLDFIPLENLELQWDFRHRLMPDGNMPFSSEEIFPLTSGISDTG